jgi:hypothetical protein
MTKTVRNMLRILRSGVECRALLEIEEDAIVPVGLLLLPENPGEDKE